MRTKFTSGPPVTTHDGELFTTKGFEGHDHGVRTTHYVNEGSGNMSSKHYQDSEQHAFAVPSLLVGNRLLTIAEARSNKQISMEVTTAAIRSGLLLSATAVAGRIKAAIALRAQELGISVSEAQATLVAKRKANGVQVRAAPKKKTDAGSTSGMNEGDGQLQAFDEDFQNHGDASVSDSELSEKLVPVKSQW